MNAWVKLALRNLLRNRRRSLVTLAAVTLGFAAVNVFGGFTEYMFVNLRDHFIHAQGNGHVQVFRTGFKNASDSDPSDFLLSKEEFELILATASTDPRIAVAAGQLTLNGFVNVGETNALFIGRAMLPSKAKEILDAARTTVVTSFDARGEPLSDDVPDGIDVASGLADTLDLQPDDLVILTGPTVDGQMNAADATVRRITLSPLDHQLRIPLPAAQELVGTEGVHTVSLLANNPDDADVIRDSIEAELRAQGLDVEAMVWTDLSRMYERTRKMFDLIFGLVFIIMILIVSMSVLNTIGMAVVERTTEIGTLRALGMKRRQIVGLFAIESALLGVLGSILGLALTLAVSAVVAATRPTWTPPVGASEVPLEIRLVPAYLLASFIFLGLLTLGAGILPARRAARSGIVDALGHA